MVERLPSYFLMMSLRVPTLTRPRRRPAPVVQARCPLELSRMRQTGAALYKR